MNESNDWLDRLDTDAGDDDDNEEYYHPPSPAAYSDNASPSQSSDSEIEYDDDDDQSETVIEAATARPDTEPRPIIVRDHAWKEAVDLDSLLIGVEQKLKAPFSSLEFVKNIISSSSTANWTLPFMKGGSVQQLQYEQLARESSSSSSSWFGATYISLLTQIVHRMTKPIQLQLLIAMLGLELQPDDVSTNTTTNSSEEETLESAVQGLLERAQRMDMDEWVRVLAGTVQGLLFYNPNNNTDTHPSWGTETLALWNKATEQILTLILDTARESNSNHSLTDETSMNGPLQRGDAYPFYVPLYYSLLHHSVVQSSLPDLTHVSFKGLEYSHDTPSSINIGHFSLHTQAQALIYDEMVEQTKAAEEEEQQQQRQYQNKNKDGGGVGKDSSTNGIPSSLKSTATATTSSTTTSSIPNTLMKPSNPTILAQRSKIGGMNDNIKRRGIAAGGTSAIGGGGGSGMVRPRGVEGVGTSVSSSMASRNVPMKSSSIVSQPPSTFLSKNPKVQSQPPPHTTPATAIAQEPTNNTQDEHEKRMNERKRKILETAAAAGLRKKAWGLSQPDSK